MKLISVSKVVLLFSLSLFSEVGAVSRFCRFDEAKAWGSRYLFESRRSYHSPIADKLRVYSEEELVSFPQLAAPVEHWPKINEDIFIPPSGKHYRHHLYNMNLYEPARELFGEEAFQKVTAVRSNETYLFPGKNYPRLIKDFSKLPFSASGSLWAYKTEQDYQSNRPCWIGSASLVTPFCAVTAAHCLTSHETGGSQPSVYAFVLHHYGEMFSVKKRCKGYKISGGWFESVLKKTKPSSQSDYGLVFFLPVSKCRYDVLSIKKKEESLLDRQIQVTGYPGDSIELRARKLWPDNATPMRFRYLAKPFE